MPWERIDREAVRIAQLSLRDLFAANPKRFDEFSVEDDGLLIDFSREKLDSGVMSALFELAREACLEDRRDALFAGESVNVTENRPALHPALRDGVSSNLTVDGRDIVVDVRTMRDKFLDFAENVRSGLIAATDGAPFEDVISIGIGGSDLGPAMTLQALRPDADGPRVHFLSNLDMAHFEDVTGYLDPRRTLVIVQSKSFATPETLANAEAAKAWLTQTLGADARDHLSAVSSNIAAAKAFGIDPSRVFGFWDWVGGRYSIWSAIGLPLAIAIGADRFKAFLAGARSMDCHFRTASLPRNMPMLLALIGIWRRNGMGCTTVAVVPYAQRLKRFPAWLQQLDMESNGKGVTEQGAAVTRDTGPVIWGESGTNGQHSFFQYLHQSPQVTPVDFLIAAKPRGSATSHHSSYLANALAQAQALAFGQSKDEALASMAALPAEERSRLAAHRTFPGNRPSTIIAYRTLDPYTLGRLMALFEHKVFMQGVLWGIDSFDQWGVELGKTLARDLEPPVAGESGTEIDPTVAPLIDWLRQQ